MAAPIAWLLSDAASFINGEALSVEGGLLARASPRRGAGWCRLIRQIGSSARWRASLAVRGHLDAATSGVPPTSSISAVRDAVDACEPKAGSTDRPSISTYGVHVRPSPGSSGRRPTTSPMAASASVFAGLVAAAVPAGGEVLFATGDFTSVLFPMSAQEPRGIRVREVPLEQIPEAIDARMSLVAVSAVQSADGRLVDLDALVSAAEHHGADVDLDATQAAGWLPIDAARFTFVCASAYKFLLSPRGTALMAVRPEAVQRVTPHTAGWYAGADPWSSIYGGPLRLPATAKRFDVSPAWTCWARTAPSLELIDELGPAAIGAYDLALAARLRSGLGMPPYDSAIVIADRPQRRGAAAAGRRQGVGVRAGRVRLSCHLPATAGDIIARSPLALRDRAPGRSSPCRARVVERVRRSTYKSSTASRRRSATAAATRGGDSAAARARTPTSLADPASVGWRATVSRQTAVAHAGARSRTRKPVSASV